MKNKTAIKQSWASVKFLFCTLPVVWAAYAWAWHWSVLIVATLMTLFLVGDVVNIVYLKRKARNAPGYLDERVG